MPELPEVETVRRSLAQAVCGRRIDACTVRHPDVVRNLEPALLEEVLRGNRFTGFRRRGKYLLGDLESGHVLVVHLGMTGRLFVVETPGEPAPHTHLILELEGGAQLRFQDVRRFGGIYLLAGPDDQSIPGLAAMGPEPLDPDFTEEHWCRHLDGRRGNLKARLLDQRLVAGIGNIYADEILFACGISPQRDLASLSRAERIRLFRQMHRILMQAIEEGGSSIRDYVDGRGQAGGFQNRHRVYGRKGQKCTVCGRTLSGCRISGRSTVFCEHCQR